MIFACLDKNDFPFLDCCLFREECLSLPWSCSPITLTFLHSIASTLFPNNGINDVIEAGDGEVSLKYVYALIVPTCLHVCTPGCLWLNPPFFAPIKVYVIVQSRLFHVCAWKSVKGVCDAMAAILSSGPGQPQSTNCPREAPGPFPPNSHPS